MKIFNSVNMKYVCLLIICSILPLFAAIDSTRLRVTPLVTYMPLAQLLLGTEDVINQSRINATDGLIITTPGKYLLQESISWSKAISPIIISSSDVTIDMNQYCIGYMGSSANIHGILISDGVKNVLIENGTVTHFTGNGIYAQGTSESKIQNVTLKKMIVVDNHTNGALFEYVDTARVQESEVDDNNSATAAAKICGVKALNSINVLVSNSTANRNRSTAQVQGSYAYGIMFDTCTRSVIQNSVASANSGYDLSSGIQLTGSSECSIDQSNTSVNQVAFENNSYGINVTNSVNNIITGNRMDENGYGIYDDEATAGSTPPTNIYTSNIAYQNPQGNFQRLEGVAPINFETIAAPYLQAAIVGSSLSNFAVIKG